MGREKHYPIQSLLFGKGLSGTKRYPITFQQNGETKIGYIGTEAGQIPEIAPEREEFINLQKEFLQDDNLPAKELRTRQKNNEKLTNTEMKKLKSLFEDFLRTKGYNISIK